MRVGRRALGAALTAAVLAAALAPAASARDAYVANATLDTVSVVDLATETVVVPSIQVKAEPTAVAISPDGSRAYVANYVSHSISVIDTATNKVLGEPIAVGANPIQLVVSPDGKRLYVRHRNVGLITVIDTATDKVSAEFHHGAGGIALSPDGHLLYAAEVEEVGIYDALTGQSAGAKLPAEVDPGNLILSPDDRTLFTTHEGSNGTLTAIDLATGTKTGPIAVGDNPESIAITPNGARLYVGRLESPTVGFVTVLDAHTFKLVGFPVGVGANPYALAAAPDGGRIWTGTGTGVQSIETEAGATTTIKLAGNHAGIAIVPNQGPTARLTATLSGATATLAAGASSDPDGHVASYSWDFGDGTTTSGTAATVTHAYAAGHDYTARVTPTDDEGCAATPIWNGVATLCNPAATPTATVAIDLAGPPAAAPKPAAPLPSRRRAKLRLGHLRLDPDKGTATLTVVVSGPGKLTLGGQAAHRSKRARRAGKVTLAIVPGGKVKRELGREGHATAKVSVRFAAVGLAPVRARRSIGLIERTAGAGGG